MRLLIVEDEEKTSPYARHLSGPGHESFYSSSRPYG